MLVSELYTHVASLESWQSTYLSAENENQRSERGVTIFSTEASFSFPFTLLLSLCHQRESPLNTRYPKALPPSHHSFCPPPPPPPLLFGPVAQQGHRGA